jgi:hypothetical protein
MVHDGPIRKWLCRLCVEANRLPASVDKEVSNVVYVAGNESWLSGIFDSNALYSSITANISHLYYMPVFRFDSVAIFSRGWPECGIRKTRISKPSPRNSPRKFPSWRSDHRVNPSTREPTEIADLYSIVANERPKNVGILGRSSWARVVITHRGSSGAIRLVSHHQAEAHDQPGRCRRTQGVRSKVVQLSEPRGRHHRKGAYIEESTDGDWDSIPSSTKSAADPSSAQQPCLCCHQGLRPLCPYTPQKRHFHMGLWTRTERPFLGIATPPLYGNGESELENRHFLLSKH